MDSYRQYRAPAEDGETLVDPPWPQLLDQLAAPPNTPPIQIGGMALADLSAAARQTLVKEALAYTRQYTDVDAPSADGPLVISGHQPELFHPGVWFKNFALDALAKRSGGVGIHLLIDSDLCRTPSIRVPTGSLDRPRSEAMAYDATAATMPHEERQIQDTACFDSFAERVSTAVRPFVEDPLVCEVWPAAQAARRQTPSLARALSAARHGLERAHGSKTLELPLSTVADTEPFQRFAAELLSRPVEVATAYNGALADYRIAHGLKNAAQPLPDLGIHNDGTEMPLWIWTEADPVRRALFAYHREGALTLSDQAGWQVEGPKDPNGIVAWLNDLRSAGVKVRSRALVTTLFSRLVLSDLFLHGIGGAKYDQVTDRFAERLLGVTPPPHATLTATLRLPLEHDLPREADRQALLKRRRDLRYHPEHFLSSSASPPVGAAAESKQHWVTMTKTPDNAAVRHAAIVEANQTMSESLEAERRQTDQQLDQIEQGLRDAAMLDSREHSFVLFSAELVERLERIVNR